MATTVRTRAPGRVRWFLVHLGLGVVALVIAAALVAGGVTLFLSQQHLYDHGIHTEGTVLAVRRESTTSPGSPGTPGTPGIPGTSSFPGTSGTPGTPGTPSTTSTDWISTVRFADHVGVEHVIEISENTRRHAAGDALDVVYDADRPTRAAGADQLDVRIAWCAILVLATVATAGVILRWWWLSATGR